MYNPNSGSGENVLAVITHTAWSCNGRNAAVRSPPPYTMRPTPRHRLPVGNKEKSVYIEIATKVAYADSDPPKKDTKTRTYI